MLMFNTAVPPGAAEPESIEKLTFWAEAIELARTTAFDMVLMDIQMPGMDGIEATRRLRRETALGDAVPIIALTANVFDEQRQLYLASGMDGVVGKPISPMALLAELAWQYDEGRLLPVLETRYIEENLWRAIRHGLDGDLVDFRKLREVPAADALREMVEFSAPAAERLGLRPFVANVERMLRTGNGAQRQLRAVRGTRSIYHNNAIQSWLVQENGEVKNVQVA